MTFLHIFFLLPFFALFEPLPFFGGLSLDEILVLSFLPFSLVLTPWRVISPLMMLVATITFLSLVNLSIFLQTTNFLVQMLNVLAYFSFVVFALNRINFSLDRAIHIYFSVLTFYLVVGYLQVLVFFFNSNVYVSIAGILGQANTIGTGIIGIRYFSLFHEPSHFIQFISFGYMYLFVVWLTRAHRVNLLYLGILLLSLILTSSALSIVPIMAPMLIVLMKHMFTFKGGVVFLSFLAFSTVELVFGIIPKTINQRFLDLYVGLMDVQGNLSGINASSGSLLNALNVAIQTMQNTYGMGIGFGSYKVAYDLYTNHQAAINLYNSVSGGSLLIRIFTEFGLIGLILLLIILFLRLRLAVKGNKVFYCFSWACLIVVLTSFARLGGYTTGLFPFAFIGYIFGYQTFKHNLANRTFSKL